MRKHLRAAKRPNPLQSLALVVATSSLFGLSLPLRAQQIFFTQSGSNYTYPVNQLPFNGNPSSLDFTGNTVQIAGNNSPGSFSAQAGALLKADGLSIGYGGTSALGDVTFSGAGTKVDLGGAVNRLDVGTWGRGTLTVSGGALVDATVNPLACGNGCFNFVGNAAGSTARLDITGVNSEVRTLRGFIVGAPGVFTQAVDGFDFGAPGGTTDAFVNVLAGGKLSTQQATVGQGPNNTAALGTEKGFGTVVVDGVGSQWDVKYNSVDNSAAGVTIGNRVGGDGKVTVTNGGKLRVDGTGSPAGQVDFINLGISGGSGALTVTGGGSSLAWISTQHI